MHNQLFATLNKNTGAYIRLFKFTGNAICFRSFGKEIIRLNISNEISLGKNTIWMLTTLDLFMEITGVTPFFSPLMINEFEL